MIIQADYSNDIGESRCIFDNVVDLHIHDALLDVREGNQISTDDLDGLTTLQELASQIHGNFQCLFDTASPEERISPDGKSLHFLHVKLIDFLSNQKMYRLVARPTSKSHAVYVMNDAGKTIQTI